MIQLSLGCRHRHNIFSSMCSSSFYREEDLLISLMGGETKPSIDFTMNGNVSLVLVLAFGFRVLSVGAHQCLMGPEGEASVREEEVAGRRHSADLFVNDAFLFGGHSIRDDDLPTSSILPIVVAEACSIACHRRLGSMKTFVRTDFLR